MSVDVGSDTFVSDWCRIGVGLVSDWCQMGVGLVSDVSGGDIMSGGHRVWVSL